MKNIAILTILGITTVISACDKAELPNQKTALPASQALELKITNWGPQSTTVGSNPNRQSDDSMGIWIEVTGLEGLGGAEVVFAGQPAKKTSIDRKLITAAISFDQIAVVGDKEVTIKQVGTGRQFPVGVFKVTEQ